jgi:folate-dependent phosphoribosylglycinamide formyltransferase PurN
LGTERIVVLGGLGTSTRIVCNALRARWRDVPVILEAPVPTARLVLRRVKRLGLVTVLGQIAFKAAIVPMLRLRSRSRTRDIVTSYALDLSPIREDVLHVHSANAPETHAHLRRLAPAVVVVNGTRILTRETITSVNAPMINTHAGITPYCRGVHGGYWALADGRPDFVGTTVHLVDTGIDTGEVLAQATFTPSRDDSFATYPYLHTAVGIPLLVQVVEAALEGRLLKRPSISAGCPSVLRTHPTAWGYLWRRLVHGVR